MTQTASYFTAAVPEPCQVLGLRLKHFCLGHYINLSRFGSAFVNEGVNGYDLKDEAQRNAMRDEVIFAAVVCYFTYEEFQEFIQQADAFDQMVDLGRQQGLFSIKEKAKLLGDYIKTASDVPGFVFEGEPSQSGAHWAHVVKVGVVSHCGYSHTEAMNAPLKQVWADFLKHAESNGAVQLISDEEMRQIKELEKN